MKLDNKQGQITFCYPYSYELRTVNKQGIYDTIVVKKFEVQECERDNIEENQHVEEIKDTL